MMTVNDSHMSISYSRVLNLDKKNESAHSRVKLVYAFLRTQTDSVCLKCDL